MFPDPPDKNTVFCQACGEWCHPRSKCARDSSHSTAPLPVMKLRRKGPLASSEFDRTSYESKKKHSIAKFQLQANSHGTRSTFGSTNAIYYLRHEHTPTQVLELWIEVNRNILEGRGLTTESVTRALSNQDFQSAWTDLCEQRDFDVLDEPDHSDRGGDHCESRECPYCDEVINILPGHLPCADQ